MVCGPWHCRDLLFPDQILRSFRVDRDRAVSDRSACGVQEKKRAGAFGKDDGTGSDGACVRRFEHGLSFYEQGDERHGVRREPYHVVGRLPDSDGRSDREPADRVFQYFFHADTGTGGGLPLPDQGVCGGGNPFGDRMAGREQLPALYERVRVDRACGSL